MRYITRITRGNRGEVPLVIYSRYNLTTSPVSGSCHDFVREDTGEASELNTGRSDEAAE